MGEGKRTLRALKNMSGAVLYLSWISLAARVKLHLRSNTSNVTASAGVLGAYAKCAFILLTDKFSGTILREET